METGCLCGVISIRRASGSFPPERVFWLFLSQVLCTDGACRDAVRRFLAWRALEGEAPASPKTGAYCKARLRLPLQALEQLHHKVLKKLGALEGETERWCGRVVKVVDGSAISMPDTPENQERYPQSKRQKMGCGFPTMRIVGIFSLSSGMLLDMAKGTLWNHERPLFAQLWELLKVDDVLLADRGFCSYGDFLLLGKRGVDCVMRNHQRRTVGIRTVKHLGKGERLILWLKMKPCPKGWTPEAWKKAPETLLVREIKVSIEEPGFRTKSIVVVTSLLDSKRYPAEAIADLYRRRWRVELYFRDIKTTMGMDILRCKTPDMVEKELYMHFIAYNLIRGLLLKSAQTYGVSSERLSFKGAIATVREWAPILAFVSNEQQLCEIRTALMDAIARDTVPLRPNRLEPRAVKRRPKNYQRLTKPRKDFMECPHRNKYCKP